MEHRAEETKIITHEAVEAARRRKLLATARKVEPEKVTLEGREFVYEGRHKRETTLSRMRRLLES